MFLICNITLYSTVLYRCLKLANKCSFTVCDGAVFYIVELSIYHYDIKCLNLLEGVESAVTTTLARIRYTSHDRWVAFQPCLHYILFKVDFNEKWFWNNVLL